MKKIACITGTSGQDGSYLADLLLNKNYVVVAADRRSARSDNWRHKYLNIEKKLIYENFDLTDQGSIDRLIKNYKFDEFYNLAAQSFVGSSFNTPISTSEINGMGVLRILESIRLNSPKTKFYQASTSEMFGKTSNSYQNEQTIFYPRSPYAVAKTFGHYIGQNYRDSFGLFISNGILFNHESPLRGEEFVTRKITIGMSEIFYNKKRFLELGNLDAKRDWGYAKDYVEAMWKMLQQKKSDDFVVSTGQSHSVSDFINQCCKLLGIQIKWKGKGINRVGINLKTNRVIIKVNPNLYRPAEVDYLRGSSKKAKSKLKWKVKTNFKQLVKIMLDADLDRVKKSY